MKKPPFEIYIYVCIYKGKKNLSHFKNIYGAIKQTNWSAVRIAFSKRPDSWIERVAQKGLSSRKNTKTIKYHVPTFLETTWAWKWWRTIAVLASYYLSTHVWQWRRCWWFFFGWDSFCSLLCFSFCFCKNGVVILADFNSHLLLQKQGQALFFFFFLKEGAGIHFHSLV